MPQRLKRRPIAHVTVQKAVGTGFGRRVAVVAVFIALNRTIAAGTGCRQTIGTAIIVVCSVAIIANFSFLDGTVATHGFRTRPAAIEGCTTTVRDVATGHFGFEASGGHAIGILDARVIAAVAGVFLSVTGFTIRLALLGIVDAMGALLARVCLGIGLPQTTNAHHSS